MAGYRFREGYRVPKGITAVIAAQVIAELHATGDIAVSRLIEVSTPKEAPLHPCFEWDNRKAASEYRLIQGRNLMRSVVRVEETPRGEAALSLVVHVPPETGKGEGVYRYLDDTLLERTDEYERALVELKRKLDAAEGAFHEVRRLSQGRSDGSEALAIAVQGFRTIQEALTLLKSKAA